VDAPLKGLIADDNPHMLKDVRGALRGSDTTGAAFGTRPGEDSTIDLASFAGASAVTPGTL
jgi:hypothetical protein